MLLCAFELTAGVLWLQDFFFFLSKERGFQTLYQLLWSLLLKLLLCFLFLTMRCAHFALFFPTFLALYFPFFFCYSSEADVGLIAVLTFFLFNTLPLF